MLKVFRKIIYTSSMLHTYYLLSLIIIINYNSRDKLIFISYSRFYYQLIAVYELYVLGSLDESFQEIKTIVESINLCKFDETNNQYLAAYIHIAHSTLAYISLSMGCYSEKVKCMLHISIEGKLVYKLGYKMHP